MLPLPWLDSQVRPHSPPPPLLLHVLPFTAAYREQPGADGEH